MSICSLCVHIDACRAWVRHGKALYEDFEYSVDNCPQFTNNYDIVEVVHGRWKYYHKQNIAVCTNCSFERDLDVNFGKAVSCPNCGAKMDLED